MLKKTKIVQEPEAQEITASDLPVWVESGDTATKRTAQDRQAEDLDNMGKTTLMRVALKGFVRLIRAADHNKDLLHGLKFGVSCLLSGACIASSIILWVASTWQWATLSSVIALVPPVFAAKNFWQQMSTEPGPLAKQAQQSRTKENITPLGLTIEN